MNVAEWELYYAIPCDFYGVKNGTTIAFDSSRTAEAYLEGFAHGGRIIQNNCIVGYVEMDNGTRINRSALHEDESYN